MLGYYHVRGSFPEAAGPPLCGSEGGRVQHKLLPFQVIGCRGLQAPHKSAMAKLGLCIGAYELQAQGLGQPLCLLVWAGLR